MKKHKADILNYTNRMSAENVTASRIDPELYEHYSVKRGLRDKSGTGVLAGLTTISNIKSYEDTPEGHVPCAGELRYRGINVTELVRGCIAEKRFERGRTEGILRHHGGSALAPHEFRA